MTSLRARARGLHAQGRFDEVPRHHADRARAGPDHRRARSPPTRASGRSSTTRVLAEELGFDGFGVGERHERPVHLLLAAGRAQPHRRAAPSAIRLFTAVTTLSLLDPVPRLRGLRHPRPPLRRPARADHRQGQRRGAGASCSTSPPRTSGTATARATSCSAGSGGRTRSPGRPGSGPSLHEAETWPRPLQQPIRVWHGSATSRTRSTWPRGTATRCSPPTSPTRSSPTPSWCATTGSGWEHHGHDPADALVGAGTAGFYARRTSQEADRRLPADLRAHGWQLFSAARPRRRSSPRWRTSSSAAPRWSAARSRSSTRCHRYHEQFGHEVCTCTPTPTGSPTRSTGRRWSCSSPTSPRCCAGRSPTRRAAGRARSASAGAAIDPGRRTPVRPDDTSRCRVLDLAPISSGLDASREALRNTRRPRPARPSVPATAATGSPSTTSTPGWPGASPPWSSGLIAAATRPIRVGSGAVQLGHRTAAVRRRGVRPARRPATRAASTSGLGRSGGRAEAARPAPAPPRRPSSTARAVDGAAHPARRSPSPALLGSPRFAPAAASCCSSRAREPQDYAEQRRRHPRPASPAPTARRRASRRTPCRARAPTLEVWILGSSGGESAAVAGERGLRVRRELPRQPGHGARGGGRPTGRRSGRPPAGPRRTSCVSADVVVGRGRRRRPASSPPATGCGCAASAPARARSRSRRRSEAAAHPWTDEDRALVAGPGRHPVRRLARPGRRPAGDPAATPPAPTSCSSPPSPTTTPTGSAPTSCSPRSGRR